MAGVVGLEVEDDDLAADGDEGDEEDDLGVDGVFLQVELDGLEELDADQDQEEEAEETEQLVDVDQEEAAVAVEEVAHEHDGELHGGEYDHAEQQQHEGRDDGALHQGDPLHGLSPGRSFTSFLPLFGRHLTTGLG